MAYSVEANSMLFFGDRNHHELSRSLAKALNTRAHFPKITKFPDGEKRVKLSGDLSGEVVYILKSFTPRIDSSLVELSLITDAAKKSGAQKVILIAPYLPYQRAERVFDSGEGIPLQVVARILECSGLDKIITLDPHIDNLPEFFSIPVTCVSTTALFTHLIKNITLNQSKFSIVSPDEGGAQNMQKLQKNIANSSPVILTKKRDHITGKVTIGSHRGDIHEVCMMRDDMITSGSTIGSAAQYLISHGCKKIFVLATHAVFSGDAPSLLKNSSIQHVFVTDSIPVLQNKKFSTLKILSITSTLADTILS